MGHTSPSCVSFCSLNDQTYEAQVCWSWLLFEFAEATRLMSSIGFSTNSFQNRGCYGAHVPNMLFLQFSESSDLRGSSMPILVAVWVCRGYEAHVLDRFFHIFIPKQRMLWGTRPQHAFPSVLGIITTGDSQGNSKGHRRGPQWQGWWVRETSTGKSNKRGQLSMVESWMMEYPILWSTRRGELLSATILDESPWTGKCGGWRTCSLVSDEWTFSVGWLLSQSRQMVAKWWIYVFFNMSKVT